MERIDELTAAPVVGQFYLVPTVYYPWYGRRAHWPVMGPRHEDAEHLNFPPMHYHIDCRFLTPAQWRFADQRWGGWNINCGASPLTTRDLPDHPEPVWKCKQCQRSDHEYPRERATSKAFQALWSAYAGRPCGKNASGQLVCPHRGFPLGSLIPDATGHVTCPLHGLRIDVRAGRCADDQSVSPHAERIP